MPGAVMPPYVHSVLAVAIVSALIPPAGAAMNRQFVKAIAVLILCGGALAAHYMVFAVAWAVFVIDAIFTAQRHYRGEVVRPWDFF